MTDHDRYDEAYALLVHVLEQDIDVPDTQRLCLMEAFTILADLESPEALPPVADQSDTDSLRSAARLLGGLVLDAQSLDEALELTRARDLIGVAVGDQP